MRKAELTLSNHFIDRSFEGKMSYKKGDILEVYTVEEVIDKMNTPKGKKYYESYKQENLQSCKPLGFIYVDDYVQYEPVYKGWVEFIELEIK